MTDIRIYLAPLQGITDHTYRTVFNRHFTGIDRAYAPYVTTKPVGYHRQYSLRGVVPAQDEGVPLVPQILSNSGKDALGLARLLQRHGYGEVNFNLGCPFATAVTKKRGAGFLPDTDGIDRFLDTFCAGFGGRCSVKVRLGLHDAGDLEALVPVFNRYPLTEVIIHPRTGKQMYRGLPDLDAFGRLYMLPKASVCYNGDINRYGDYLDRAARFPEIGRFMLGRGLVADPLLAERIRNGRPDGIPDGRERVLRFMDDLFDAVAARLSGHAHVADKMKGIWKCIGPTFRGYRKPLKALLKSKGVDAYRTAVDRFIADTEWPDDGAPGRPVP